MYKRILIVVGVRPVDRVAVKEGVALAKVHGAEVLFFHVLPRYIVPVADLTPMVTSGSAEFERDVRANGQRLLAADAVVADKAGVRNVGATGTGADDAECIVEAVRKRRCGLVVAATEGRNALVRLLTGSVIPGLITLCPVPVLVVRKAPARSAGARKAVQPRAPRRARAAAAVAMTRRPVLI
jgi:nucleotide-binding universal stress UspA family protein